MSRVRITIDRLVLKGVEPGDRDALVEAFRAELSQVLANPTSRAALLGSRRMPILRLGRIPLESGPASARRFGRAKPEQSEGG